MAHRLEIHETQEGQKYVQIDDLVTFTRSNIQYWKNFFIVAKDGKKYVRIGDDVITVDTVEDTSWRCDGCGVEENIFRISGMVKRKELDEILKYTATFIPDILCKCSWDYENKKYIHDAPYPKIYDPEIDPIDILMNGFVYTPHWCIMRRYMDADVHYVSNFESV